MLYGIVAKMLPLALIGLHSLRDYLWVSLSWRSLTCLPDAIPNFMQLLYCVYSAFDKVAKRRKILKVESVKDSYLAVAGVPTPRDDHAVVMVRFADECNREMSSLVQYLEKMLGPDTSSLSMRFGIHSGAVTAGVLRGAKARFQLFGDTVNTGKMSMRRASSIRL